MHKDSTAPNYAHDVARFTDKQTHLFRETTTTTGRTFCGLSERYEIWQPVVDDTPTCTSCLRHAGRQPGEGRG